MTQYLVAQGLFDSHPFSLVDVGASGGIEQHWRVFGRALRAWGFDPLIAEVSRLNAMTQGDTVSYHAVRVTGPARADERGASLADKLALKDNQPFARTSAARAIAALKVNYVRQFYDPAGSGVETAEQTSLDEFFAATPHPGIDFIKVDTDGDDFDVLRGAERVIGESPALGVCVEIQFHGPVRADANLFGNIDSFLRARGFSLFDIDVHRYSRSVLPQKFVYGIPAQTQGGQVLWGDALYLRDAGDPDYEAMWGVPMSAITALKLAAVHELYGLEDCAAEVLCTYKGCLEKLIDVEHCLNLLTPDFMGRRVAFREYQEMFQRDPRQWFPDPRAPGERPPREVDYAGIDAALAGQQREIAGLRQRLEEWQRFWRSVEDSAGWRLLSSWRRVRDRLAPEGTRRRRCYGSFVGRFRGGDAVADSSAGTRSDR